MGSEDKWSPSNFSLERTLGIHLPTESEIKKNPINSVLNLTTSIVDSAATVTGIKQGLQSGATNLSNALFGQQDDVHQGALPPKASNLSPAEVAQDNLIKEIDVQADKDKKAKENILQQSALEAQARQKKQRQASGMTTKNRTILTSPQGVKNELKPKRTLLGE